MDSNRCRSTDSSPPYDAIKYNDSKDLDVIENIESTSKRNALKHAVKIGEFIKTYIDETVTLGYTSVAIICFPRLFTTSTIQYPYEHVIELFGHIMAKAVNNNELLASSFNTLNILRYSNIKYSVDNFYVASDRVIGNHRFTSLLISWSSKTDHILKLNNKSQILNSRDEILNSRDVVLPPRYNDSMSSIDNCCVIS